MTIRGTSTIFRRGPAGSLFRRLSDLARAATVAALLGAAAVAVADDSGQHKVLTLAVVNGAVPDVGDTIRVKQGDDLEFRWSGDKPMELHLHGYDIEVKITPPAPAVMAFRARLPGRFPIEVHGQGRGPHRPILYLEVYP